MKGISVSPGISIGRAFVMKKTKAVLSGVLLSSQTEVARAVASFEHAVRSAVDEVEAIKANRQLLLVHQDLAILETQIELLSDPQLKADVTEKIVSGRNSAADALIEVIETFTQLFEGMEDPYMRARTADIKDIGDRILKHLGASGNSPFQDLGPDSIIIAEDISPSQTITMDFGRVIGFATQAGSKTSHTAIIAKSKGIPAVVGCGDQLSKVMTDDLIILDGSNGLVYVNPEQDLVSHYSAKRAAYQQMAGKRKALKHQPAITTDGKRITLSANIAGAEDLADVFEYGGQGVGLLRTELLFMNRGALPTEDEQFEFYKNVGLGAKGVPVIVRTLDIGGDKQLPYFNLPIELNPFLGYRAIRICLDRKELFIAQLKAILRASALADLKIMFPMISNIQEIRSAKKILAEAKDELSAVGAAFNDGIKVGIMVEIPSAAVMADILAKEVDFFSIGTNDLCQYTLAVDRMNDKIAHLYDPFNPAVLRLIANVTKQGREHGIHVGICGEMASDPAATLLLLGMGIEDLSMNAACIPEIKNIIINHSIIKAQEIYNKVMQLDNSQQIMAYLQEQTT